MKLQTLVETSDYGFKINHSHTCMLIGSCFANNIGEKLKSIKINGDYNPLGILYNPISILNSLSNCISQKKISEKELFLSEDSWKHFDFHSSFAKQNQDDSLFTINNALSQTNRLLKKTDYLFVSFGTAFYYKLKNSDRVVSNCHKQNPETFDRGLADVNEISTKWIDFIKKIKEINSKIKIIFTVSPIRYLKDGAVNNQISKSILLLSVYEIRKYFNNDGFVFYFPSYEIMMDELRDYRFYDIDMVHPSELAINIIWEKFSSLFFDAKTIQLNKQIERIHKAVAHRPFNINSSEYKTFCKGTIKLINEINSQYPDIDFKNERETLNFDL